MFKSIREKSNKFLSDVFYFHEDDGKPKGDHSLIKNSKGRKLNL